MFKKLSIVKQLPIATATVGLMTVGATFAHTHTANAIYLNNSNITVEVGPGTSPGSFNNTFSNGNTIDKVIDAPYADATEVHNQTSHIWFTADEVGGGLELLFDFGQKYDLTTLHFWNYDEEIFDVDNIDFTFFNEDNIQVGQLSVTPALGTAPRVTAEDISLDAPLNVQFITAFLSGTNRQVDFQNLGFTGQVSNPSVPEPTSVPEATSIISLIVIGGICATSQRKSK
ncbi:MAG: hypothetical protein WBA93_27115 [Microcoleaceae cyanobacterium]